MSTVVYTPKTSRFTVGGTRYDIASFSMSLATNSIPAYTVGISVEQSMGDNGGNKVHTVSLSDLKRIYSELQQKAIELKECNLELELEVSGMDVLESRIEPKIKLDGWLLTWVGMSNITTTDAFSVICQVTHPAYRLTLEMGAIAKSTGVLDLSESSSQVKDPLDASKKAIEILEKANDSNEQKTLEEQVDASFDLSKIQRMRDEIAKRMSSVKSNIDKYLLWDEKTYVTHGKQIPLGQLQELKEGIQYALVNDWLGSMIERSYFSALVSIISPRYGLEVLPKYDQDQLIVCPSLPWKDTEPCKITVKDQLCFSLVLPGQDTDPVFGYVAIIDKLAPAGGLITVTKSGSEKTSTILNQIAFIPKSTTSSVGRIRYMNTPDWLETARQKMSSTKNTQGVTTSRAAYSNWLERPVEMGGGDNKQLMSIDSGILAHLENCFVLEYKKGVTAVLSCPLMFKIDDKLLFPGQRLAFESKGEKLFYGTVADVRHIVTCAESTAGTVIQLSHCTFVGGADKEILGAQPKAPYYEAAGSLEW